MGLHELIEKLRRLDKEYHKGEIRLKDYQEERNRISKEISVLKTEETRKLKREKFKLIMHLRAHNKDFEDTQDKNTDKERKKIRGEIDKINKEIDLIEDIDKTTQSALKHKFSFILAAGFILAIVVLAAVFIKPNITDTEGSIQKYTNLLLADVHNAEKPEVISGIFVSIFILFIISSVIVWISANLTGLDDAKFSKSLQSMLAVAFIYVAITIIFIVPIIMSLFGISGYIGYESVEEYKTNFSHFLDLTSMIELIILTFVGLFAIKSVFRTEWKKAAYTLIVCLIMGAALTGIFLYV